MGNAAATAAGRTGGLGRALLLAACLALLALGTAQRAAANQVGDPVGNGTGQAAACEAFGGSPHTTVTRTVGGGVTGTVVTCEGGLLDGMLCDNTTTYSVCLPRGVVEEGPAAGPIGGIEVEEPVRTPPTVGEAGPPAGGIEAVEPVVEEPVVVEPIVEEPVVEEPVAEPVADEQP